MRFAPLNHSITGLFSIKHNCMHGMGVLKLEKNQVCTESSGEGYDRPRRCLKYSLHARAETNRSRQRQQYMRVTCLDELARPHDMAIDLPLVSSHTYVRSGSDGRALRPWAFCFASCAVTVRPGQGPCASTTGSRAPTLAN
jgi:hypothetical protein